MWFVNMNNSKAKDLKEESEREGLNECEHKRNIISKIIFSTSRLKNEIFILDPT